MASWVRFEHQGTVGFGMLDAATTDAGMAHGTIAVHDGTMFAPSPSGRTLALGEVRLLPPVMPGKIVALWNNFHELSAKLGTAVPTEPLYFLKATSSLLAPGETIRPPASYAGKVVFEGELGVVIGRTCYNISEADAAEAIFGYTCVNDVTAQDILNADPSFAQWARCKSFDTFGPLGPAVVTGLDPAVLRIRTVLNGQERQNYPVSDMILPPARIVSLLSREMTLHSGDVIACGTSVGVGSMRAGAVVEIVIDGIGTLRNVMAAA